MNHNLLREATEFTSGRGRGLLGGRGKNVFDPRTGGPRFYYPWTGVARIFSCLVRGASIFFQHIFLKCA